MLLHPIVESAHSTKQSNGHHIKRASDEIVDITDDDDDEAIEEDDDSDQRYLYIQVLSLCGFLHVFCFLISSLLLLLTDMIQEKATN